MKQLLKIILTVALSLTIFKSSSNDILNTPEKVVLKFYQWYLKDIYLKKYDDQPKVILTKDSIYKLDLSKSINFLKQCGYFSDKFYNNEKAMFSSCDEQLKKVNPRQVEETGVPPSMFVEGNACDFLNYMVWTGGQGEALTAVEIKSSKILADSAIVIAIIEDAKGYKYSYPQVTLLKENEEWKISRIVISYKE